MRVGTRVEMHVGMPRVLVLPDLPPQVTSDSTYQPVRSAIAWVRAGIRYAQFTIDPRHRAVSSSGTPM